MLLFSAFPFNKTKQTTDNDCLQIVQNIIQICDILLRCGLDINTILQVTVIAKKGKKMLVHYFSSVTAINTTLSPVKQIHINVTSAL